MMYKALSPGAIGVRTANLEEALAAAKTGGFEGVEYSPHEIADRVERQGAASVLAVFQKAGIHPAGFGLPTEWRSSDENWKQGLLELPRLAKAAQAVGGARTMTWIMPCSNERAFDANYRFHVARFKPIARILADNDCLLGLEFIGPKTLRDSQKYPFVHTMEAMLQMAKDIGPNVGLLLDCWHWHTSHGTVEELRRLKPQQIAYVHVNDAPAGIETDRQVDSVRDLPGATGVIDIAGFLQALQAIGYNGPVTPEPFQKGLAALPDDTARLQTVGAAMDRIFAKVRR